MRFRFRYLAAGIILTLLAVTSLSTGAEKRIKPGHTLKITVSGHPEFSQSVLVRQDGTTEYPLLAGIPVDGLTQEELRDLLMPVLLRFETEPEVFVIISETQLLKVQVQGEVNRPGRYEAESPLNLQQAVMLAGGPSGDSDPRYVHILRLEDEKRIDIMYDLMVMFTQDTLMLAPELKDGDIVVIPGKRNELMVQVLGSVPHPGSYIPNPGDNLFQVIMQAGGFASGADERRTVLISLQAGQRIRTVINVKKMIREGRYDELPLILPGDMVIVPELADWRDAKWWIDWVRNLMVFTSSALILVRYVELFK